MPRLTVLKNQHATVFVIRKNRNKDLFLLQRISVDKHGEIIEHPVVPE